MAVAAATLVSLAFLQSGLGHRLLTVTGLAPKPNRYLELYFAYPGGHPTDITPESGLVQVAFVIRSHDLDVTDQGWTVSVSDGATVRPVAHGVASLRPGQQSAITRSVVVPCASSKTSTRTSVSVSLDGTEQQILFWLNCNPTVPATAASPTAGGQ